MCFFTQHAALSDNAKQSEKSIIQTYEISPHTNLPQKEKLLEEYSATSYPKTSPSQRF